MGGYSAYSAYSACSAYSAKSAYSTYFAYSAYSAYCYLLSKNIKHHRSVVCSFICLCISIFLDPAWCNSYSESCILITIPSSGPSLKSNSDTKSMQKC